VKLGKCNEAANYSMRNEMKTIVCLELYINRTLTNIKTGISVIAIIA